MAVSSTSILARGVRRATFVRHPMPRVTLPPEARLHLHHGRRRADVAPLPLAAKVGLIVYLTGVGAVLGWGALFVTPDGSDLLAVIAVFAVLAAASVLTACRVIR